MAFSRQMCVLQNSRAYGGVGNSVCYEWQEPDLSGGRQAPEHRCVKHEITSAREGSGEAPPQRNVENSNLKLCNLVQSIS